MYVEYFFAQAVKFNDNGLLKWQEDKIMNCHCQKMGFPCNMHNRPKVSHFVMEKRKKIYNNPNFKFSLRFEQFLPHKIRLLLLQK